MPYERCTVCMQSKVNTQCRSVTESIIQKMQEKNIKFDASIQKICIKCNIPLHRSRALPSWYNKFIGKYSYLLCLLCNGVFEFTKISFPLRKH